VRKTRRLRRRVLFGMAPSSEKKWMMKSGKQFILIPSPRKVNGLFRGKSGDFRPLPFPDLAA
jgi:hypothetical protein